MTTTTTATAAMPRVLSLNVGDPRDVEWNGSAVPTGIFKTAVPGPVRLANHAVGGDHVADLRVHGGPDKAVYAFPSEHYPGWREAFPNADWSWGAFGENLTTTGLFEDRLCVGDRFACGTAELEVRQPREPCFKFAIRIGDKGAVGHMIETGQCGVYFGITREGEVRTDDPFELVAGPTADGKPGLTIAAFYGLIYDKAAPPETLRAAAQAPALPASWRERFLQRAEKAGDG